MKALQSIDDTTDTVSTTFQAGFTVKECRFVAGLERRIVITPAFFINQLSPAMIFPAHFTQARDEEAFPFCGEDRH